MTNDLPELQQQLQIADALDEQAAGLNKYIADPDVPKPDRQAAAKHQVELRQQAADLRVNLIEQLLDEAGPSLSEILAAIDSAKSAASRINNIKNGLDIAGASIAFLAAIIGKNPKQAVASFNSLRKLTQTEHQA